MATLELKGQDIFKNTSCVFFTGPWHYFVRATGSGYAAQVTLDAADVTCGDPWVAQVRAENEMGPGPPAWYTTLVRITDLPMSFYCAFALLRFLVKNDTIHSAFFPQTPKVATSLHAVGTIPWLENDDNRW